MKCQPLILKKNTIILQYKKLWKILTIKCRGVMQLRKLRSSNTKWSWHKTYQHLYEKFQAIIKKNATMTFYNQKEQQYLETYLSGLSLTATLLQMRDSMWCPRNKAPNNVAL